MDKPTRNRRLVTYGCATKSQPRPNTEQPARSSPIKTAFKEGPLSSSSRPPRSSQTKAQRDKNGDEQPSGSLEVAIPRARPPSNAITESNVFDIPSSDDEQTSLLRRKRRRHSPDGTTAILATRSSGKPSVMENGTRHASSKIAKKVPGGRSPLAKKREADKQTIAVRPSTRVGRPVRSQPKIPTVEPEPMGPTGKSLRQAEPVRDPVREPSSEMSPPCTPKANITPSRRRLIDSLGITEDRVETSPESPASSQPSRGLNPARRTTPGVAVNESPVDSQMQGSPTSVPSHLQGSRVTYARQRSFLDDMMSEDLLADDLHSGPSHRSRSVQRQLKYEATPTSRLIVPNEDVNEEESVRSIHELRQAGGNARYRGAVDSIFEDIEDAQNSLAGRCSAFLQLCGKLLDHGLKRRFLECSFDKRLVDSLSLNLQLVPMVLAFCAYALASSDGQMSYVLATSAWPKLLDASPMLLGVQDEIPVLAKAATSGLSRPLQKTLQEIVPQISEMLFPDITMLDLTPCTLALCCLKSTIAILQTKGEKPILSTPVLRTLVQILVSECRRCVSLGKSGTQSSQALSISFSILEACTASTDLLTDEHRDILSPLSELHSLLSLDLDTVCQIQPLYIRLLLNITNSNPSLCDQFANAELVGGLVHVVSANFGDLTEDALGKENNSLDIVILALGALINLTEQSEVSRSTFLHSAGPKINFLDQLLHLFLTHVDSISKAHSVLEVHHNVAVGYLAVLLLTLSLDPETRSQIKRSLAPKGLTTVISTVEEFLQYHLKIEHESSLVSSQGQPATGFLSRLQELVDRIRLAEQ